MPTASGVGQLRLGKYRVLEHVAAGGMAAVYKAIDEESGVTVALKVLAPELAGREESRQRFRQEALVGARLRHEHLVAVYEYLETQGTCLLAMEFVDGITLLRYIERHGPVEPKHARALLLQIVSALDHYHEQGVIHRDIKPSNILLTNSGGKTVAKLADLGVSRETSEDEFRLTREGHTVGTVDYMAPEQARDSRAADIRSDIYSLGCTLYHMLTGSAPFPQGSLIERMIQHAERVPVDLRLVKPDVPEDLAAICRRMLAKRPEQRYQTPAELWLELSHDNRPAPDQGSTDVVVTLRRETGPSSASAPTHPAGDAADPTPAGPLVATPAPTSGPPAKTFAVATPTLVLPEDPSPTTPEQRRVAAGQFELAQKYLNANEAREGFKALRVAVRLDPTNIAHRAVMRDLAVSHPRRTAFGWLGATYCQARFYLARLMKRRWNILYFGEQALYYRPADLSVHLAIAYAARKLDCRRLAWWCLEQARQLSDGPAVHRAIALFLEREQDYSNAIRFWELVERSGTDAEARLRIKALAAHDVIAKGNLQKRIGGLEQHLEGM